MSQPNPARRYFMSGKTEQICRLLKIDYRNVLRRIEMPVDALEQEDKGVTAELFFAGLEAMAIEANRQDLGLFLGQAYARGPFNAAAHGFTASPDVRTGLERLAVFKPLVCPMELKIDAVPNGMKISLSSAAQGQPLPATMQEMELVYFVELIRVCTATHVEPLDVTLAGHNPNVPALESYFGCLPKSSTAASFTLSKEDAALPLVSADPLRWKTLETQMAARLAGHVGKRSISGRLTNVLKDCLPAGHASVVEASKRLNVSKRTLQRQLLTEGTRFQDVLDRVRKEQALAYLSFPELRVDEIAHLLAYKDPNSFYRAFQSWTGMTPLQARMQIPPADTSSSPFIYSAS